MIRLAMLSFWHVHAGEYLRRALANHATQIIAIWDETADRGHTQAQSLGILFYDNLNDLLAQTDVDGVIVDTPTTMHRDVMVAAAQAGKHIITEKVLAPTLRECNEIVAVVDKAGVKLMISLPRLYAGSTLAIKDILDRNPLGEVTQVRTRAFHDGALRMLLHPQRLVPPYFFNTTKKNWNVWTDIPPDKPTAFQQWISYITNIQATIDLSMLMEGANLSAKSNQPVCLDTLQS